MRFYSVLNLPLVGELLLVGGQRKLTGVYFADRRHAPAIERDWQDEPGHPILRQAAEEIGEYLAGERAAFSLPLAYEGNPLQQAVWQQIEHIPCGQTISYSELARRVHAEDAVRAVAAATGQNPLSIVIPCHRIVAKDGTLCGYAGGLDRKERLLRLERIHRTPSLAAGEMLFAV